MQDKKGHKATHNQHSLFKDKKGQTTGLTGFLDVFVDIAISVIIAFVVIAVGLGFMADEKSDIEAEFGNNSTAASAISTGETELDNLTSDIGTILSVIVLFLVVFLFVRLKRANQL